VVSGYLHPTRLSAAHNVDAFNCGKDQLDRFLKRHALKNQKIGSSTTFVTCPESEANRLVGYYSLTLGSVRHEDTPADVREGMPRYPIPVMLLAKLAVDSNYRKPNQDLRLGEALLKDALLKSVLVAELAGIRAMMVDALDDDARRFYQHYGFQQSPTDELQLFLPISVIRASVEAASKD